MSPEQPSNNKFGKSVGEKIRAARLAQHYTQNQLAAPDFSVSYISAIERGQIQPSLRALELLAARLNIQPTQLLPGKISADTHVNATASEHEDDEITLDLLHAQIQILQGEAAAALASLQNITSQHLNATQKLYQSYLLGQIYYQLGRYQESEYVLAESMQQARELAIPYLHLHILYQSGITYAAMRNYTQALLLHQHCLSQLSAAKLDDPFFLAHIYSQMGQHYMHLDNGKQALEMFYHALETTAEFATPEKAQDAYSNLWRYYADNQAYLLAMLYAHKGIQMHNQRFITRLRSELYHYLGRAILQTDPEQARAYLDEALLNPRNRQDTFTYASLLTHNANWYFLQKDYRQAEEQGHQALELLQPSGDLIITAEDLLVLGRTKYAQQRYNEGNRYFEEGLDMLERLGSHEELANEAVRYAELLESIGQAHEAFTFFRRAFQSSQKLGK